MGLFDFGKSAPAMPKFTEPMDPQWAKPGDRGYFRYIHLDPEEQGLDGQSGVYVIWHGGVRPEWLYVGSSNNISDALHTHSGDKKIMDYESQGNLFVTWAFIKSEYQKGVVAYLSDVLKPLLSKAPSLSKDEQIPVITP